MIESVYFDKAIIAQAAAEGRHREIVGGAWDEIGKLQLSFLLTQGLRPHHKLLDIGCGSLRGGVHFVPYLEEGHYFGIDLNQALLDSAWKELSALGCQHRLPPENLHCSENFDFARFGQLFDFAIAQSLFTHLTFNRIRRCLEEVSECLANGGVLFATFFNRPDNLSAKQPRIHPPAGIQTHDVSDPYHYGVEDFRHAIRNLPLDLRYIGDWNHPRGQEILAFRKGAAVATAE